MFFAWLTKQLLEEGKKLLLRYPLLFNLSFFSCSLLAVTTAVKRLSNVEPNCILLGVSFFISILLSEQVSWGQRTGGNENRGRRCSLCTLLSRSEGKPINLSSSDTEADSWRLMSLPRSVTGLLHLVATGILQFFGGKNNHETILWILLSIVNSRLIAN